MVLDTPVGKYSSDNAIKCRWEVTRPLCAPSITRHAALLPPCRPGLSARQPLFGGAGAAQSDQLQINIESGTLDLDDEIDQLRGSVGRLKQVGCFATSRPGPRPVQGQKPALAAVAAAGGPGSKGRCSVCLNIATAASTYIKLLNIPNLAAEAAGVRGHW